MYDGIKNYLIGVHNFYRYISKLKKFGGEDIVRATKKLKKRRTTGIDEV